MIYIYIILIIHHWFQAPEKDSEQTASSKMTGSETKTKRRQPVTQESLPSDEEIVHVLGPAELVPISPLPATPQKAAHKSTKAVASSGLKASMEKCKRLQELDKEDTEVAAVTAVKKGSKKEVGWHQHG